MRSEALQRWVDAWGAMGVLWGINRSMARVHALLLASGEPLSLDAIATELTISRGNASMCLKELRQWRVIERVHQPGDRRDYYVPEGDIWRMFVRIVTERKRRELDPALAAVRAALLTADTGVSGVVRRRLEDLEQLLGLLDSLGNRFLASEEADRGLLKVVAETFVPTRKVAR